MWLLGRIRFWRVGIAAKRDHPESVNDHDGVIGILDEVNELAGEAIERGDFCRCRIAYEDGLLVFAKITWSPYDAPR